MYPQATVSPAVPAQHVIHFVLFFYFLFFLQWQLHSQEQSWQGLLGSATQVCVSVSEWDSWSAIALAVFFPTPCFQSHLCAIPSPYLWFPISALCVLNEYFLNARFTCPPYFSLHSSIFIYSQYIMYLIHTNSC